MNIINQILLPWPARIKSCIYTTVLKFVQSVDVVPVYLGVNVQLVEWQSYTNAC